MSPADAAQVKEFGPTELRRARAKLGLSRLELARRLHMKGKNSVKTIDIWETEGNTVPGPTKAAVLLMLREDELYSGDRQTHYVRVFRFLDEVDRKKPADYDPRHDLVKEFGIAMKEAETTIDLWFKTQDAGNLEERAEAAVKIQIAYLNSINQGKRESLR